MRTLGWLFRASLVATCSQNPCTGDSTLVHCLALCPFLCFDDRRTLVAIGEWTHRQVGISPIAYVESTWEDASVARRRGVVKSLMGPKLPAPEASDG